MDDIWSNRWFSFFIWNSKLKFINHLFGGDHPDEGLRAKCFRSKLLVLAVILFFVLVGVLLIFKGFMGALSRCLTFLHLRIVRNHFSSI